jgi:NADP-dependent 3-hydroxy acid dehydrogenase YdfG
MHSNEVALIVGAGSGLSGSLARKLAQAQVRVALAARNIDKLAPLADAIAAMTLQCDACDYGQVEAAFEAVEDRWGVPSLVVYNASHRVPGPVAELDPVEVRRAVEVTALAGFHVGQAAAKRMLTRGSGAIFFTGASASIKGYANSAPFAMGKFALRGLAQSMARELSPKGIHVAHFVIDGVIRKDRDVHEARGAADNKLDPDEIASNYLHVWRQHRGAWTWEIELRPWVERF